MAILTISTPAHVMTLTASYCPSCGFCMLMASEHTAGCCIQCSITVKEDNGMLSSHKDLQIHSNKENLMLLIEEQHPEFSFWDPAYAPASDRNCLAAVIGKY